MAEPKRTSKRALTPAEIATRDIRRRRDELLGLCPDAMPAAQRDAATLTAQQVPEMEDARGRTATRTVRKLTRVERLRAAGVLEAHEADACDWYAETASLAWDTTGCTANYDGGGSGGGQAHAPDRLVARYQRIADARDDYREARALLPASYAAVFEAVVCRNEALGPTAAATFEELKRSQAEHRTRLILRFCANVLHARFASLIGFRAAPEPATARPAVASSAPASTSPELAPPTITAEVDRAIDRAGGARELWLAAGVLDALRREGSVAPEPSLGPNETAVVIYRDLPIVVREGWRWGCVPVGAAADGAAAGQEVALG